MMSETLVNLKKEMSKVSKKRISKLVAEYTADIISNALKYEFSSFFNEEWYISRDLLPASGFVSSRQGIAESKEAISIVAKEFGNNLAFFRSQEHLVIKIWFDKV